MSEYIAVDRKLLARVSNPNPCEFDDRNTCVTHGFEFLRPDEECPQHTLKMIIAENVRTEHEQ